jgi:hypothetical protein
MLHKSLQTSTRFSDASDSAKYARHAHTMRIIGLLAHQCCTYAQLMALFAGLAWEREAERCCCDRCQAAQALASLRKFRPGRSVHVGRLTSLPANRLTAIPFAQRVSPSRRTKVRQRQRLAVLATRSQQPAGVSASGDAPWLVLARHTLPALLQLSRACPILSRTSFLFFCHFPN